jgi:hypothetical protein
MPPRQSIQRGAYPLKHKVRRREKVDDFWERDDQSVSAVGGFDQAMSMIKDAQARGFHVMTVGS